MNALDENWFYETDMCVFEKQSFHEFMDKVNAASDRIMILLEDNLIKTCKLNSYEAPNNDDQLKILIERNKKLRQEIEAKIGIVTQQQTQYENLKRNRKLLSQEIKESHEAFLMAKKYYKKYLNMYYTIESRNAENETIFVQFFTEAKKDSENYSVRLLRQLKTGQYELLNTVPKLDMFKEYRRTLEDNNDVPEVLCLIRSAFQRIKNRK